MVETFLRISDVVRCTGLPKSTIYHFIKVGTFPRPVRISARLSGWRDSEIEAWQRRKVQERDGRAA